MSPSPNSVIFEVRLQYINWEGGTAQPIVNTCNNIQKTDNDKRKGHKSMRVISKIMTVKGNR